MTVREGLLGSFRAGDRAALEEVYREHVDAVFRTVAAILRRSGSGGGERWRRTARDLPDLVQEVFARAFTPKTRVGFDGQREYGPFLTQIARNVVIDHLRRERRRDAVSLEEGRERLDLLESHAEPHNDFADKETKEIVNRYLSGLPDEMRRVHEALYIQGLSQRETAEELGIGRQTVRTVEMRLREGLRRALASGNLHAVPSKPSKDVGFHRVAGSAPKDQPKFASQTKSQES